MKKFLLSLLLLMPLVVSAQQEEMLPNTLVVYLADGTTQEYPLHQAPEIAFSGTDMVITQGETTVEITRDEIDRYEFGYRVYSSVAQLTGDNNVSRRGNEVYIYNVSPGDAVTLYSVDGRAIMRTAASESGEACVSIDRLGRGVYLLSVNNFTTKIIKR